MELEDRGAVIHVSARVKRVKDDAVARAREEARGDRFNRGTTAHFTRDEELSR